MAHALAPGEKISEGTNEPTENGEQQAEEPLINQQNEIQDEELPSEINATNDAESHQAIVG